MYIININAKTKGGNMLKVKGVQKNYGALTILSDISFSLEKGQKAALVGPNGVGKTTLLKIIAGLEEADAGSIELSKNTHLGYLPQDTSLVGAETIIGYLKSESGIAIMEKEMEGLSAHLENEAAANKYGELCHEFQKIGGHNFDHRVKIILTGFGISETEFNKRLCELSSGQKSKVALASILLRGADLLLLDEPTNNLDLPALLWLENFLRNSSATCIIISHDRKFLDRVVKKVFELDWNSHALIANNGTYSNYLMMKRKRQERLKGEYEKQQEEIERLKMRAKEKKSEAEKGSHWIGTDNDKFLRGFKRDRAGKSSQVAKTLEKRIEQMDRIEKPIDKDALEIDLTADKAGGSTDINVIEVVAGYQNGFKIGPISLGIKYGQRIGILGPNGSGKSTLLKTVIGSLAPLSGIIKIGSGVKFGFLSQEHENLPHNQTPIEFLSDRTELGESKSYAKLAKFGINQVQAKRPIISLSPGNKTRLLLALFSALSVNTLVLDEPTNHLDIEAIEALEEILSEYSGTVIIVSHDRYFLSKAALDFSFVLEGGSLKKVSDYRDYEAMVEIGAKKLLRLL